MSFHLFLTSFVHADLPLDRGQRRQADDFADPPVQEMGGTTVGLYDEQGAKASSSTPGGLPPLAFLDFNRCRGDLRPPPVARANFSLASLASALPSTSPSISHQCICSFPCKYQILLIALSFFFCLQPPQRRRPRPHWAQGWRPNCPALILAPVV